MTDYSNTELIKSVKRRAMIPTNQSTFLPVDILALADDELKDTILPMIMGLQADFFVDYEDFTMEQDVKVYPIPSDAIGMKLKDVVYVDSSGNETNLPMLSDEQVTGYQWEYSTVTGFHIRDNNVVLYPNSNPGMTLRMYYYRRPNKLVENAKGGQVTGVNLETKEITISNVPSSWTAGTAVCCVAGKPGFRLRFASQEIVALSSPTIQLEDVSDIEVGDWICLEGETTIAQVPVEAHPVLAQAAAIKCLEALGDRAGMKVAQEKYDRVRENFINMVAPRVDNEPKKIVNNNGIANWTRISTRRPW